MFLAVLALLSGLTISGVAIYYSVLGLAEIFAASAVSIIVMGTVLELSKLVTASWLKANWHRTPLALKAYLTAAVLVLMFITSMGIFGYLSKAHSDQTMVSGGNTVSIAEIERQISIEQSAIDSANQTISQLDQVVQQLIDAQRIRGANGSIATRESQQAERDLLKQQINKSTERINQLQQEKLPLVQRQLELSAEVGPIKYIANFIYSDKADEDVLEKAVTWVIIIIVFVFDPLAVLLLLAAQMSFKWAADDRKVVESTPKVEEKTNLPEDTPVITAPVAESTTTVEELVTKVDDTPPLAVQDKELVEESVTIVGPETVISFVDEAVTIVEPEVVAPIAETPVVHAEPETTSLKEIVEQYSAGTDLVKLHIGPIDHYSLAGVNPNIDASSDVPINDEDTLRRQVD